MKASVKQPSSLMAEDGLGDMAKRQNLVKKVLESHDREHPEGTRYITEFKQIGSSFR